MKDYYDVIIIGTGPAGLGCAFQLKEEKSKLSILMIDRNSYSSGGLRNDCKMNFDSQVGFPIEYWDKDDAIHYLDQVKEKINPTILPRQNLNHYFDRVKQFNGVELIAVDQAHYGTDGGKLLIEKYISELESLGVDINLHRNCLHINNGKREILLEETNLRANMFKIRYTYLIVAPGRNGFEFGQKVMNDLEVEYTDNIIDIGIRIETKQDNYAIVKDYYDPKFLFPNKVRTFCTNSGKAHVVQEQTNYGYIVNGHAYSKELLTKENGLVNFAMLKTIKFTEPLASGQDYAKKLIEMVMLAGNGKPIMQRVGDFRLGIRSKLETFNNFYDFNSTLDAMPGDISLICPSKILHDIWKSLKTLDSIVPGVLNPSTIMYFPEIKFYANKPKFINDYFFVNENVALIGDGFGTSRGIVAAWASGIRAARGVIL